MSQLTAALTAHTDELATRVVDEMYRNPFWQERFGDRGRQFAEQDGRYHLSYLVQALDQTSPETLTSYARWLQEVLTARGMCTRHLDDNFARLATAIAEAGLPDPEPAREYLDLARAALRYPDGPARDVQLATTVLADAVVARLYPRDTPAAGRCRDDLGYHLAYLADALALGQPHIFVDYVVWIEAFLTRHGVPVAELDAALAALAETLVVLPEESRAAAQPLLAAGLVALREAPP